MNVTKNTTTTHDPEFHAPGAIALFVASALTAPAPPCNSASPRRSTIVVEQYKSKFDEVRIYCRLADPNEVEQAWAEEGGDGPAPADAFRRWLQQDARLYRGAYRKMAMLVPEQRRNLFGGADYSYLLFDTKDELVNWLEKHERHLDVKNGEDPNLLKFWYCETAEELRLTLFNVYDRWWW